MKTLFFSIRGCCACFLVLLAVVLSGPPAAAAEGPVTARARVAPAKATVGDEIELTVQVDRPADFSIQPLSEQFFTPFELKRLRALPVRQKGGRVTESAVLTLTIFETGDFSVPPVEVVYTDASGRTGKAWTTPLPVKIMSVAKQPLTEKSPLKPIKGAVSLSTALIRQFFLGLLALALFIFLVFKIYRRRLKQVFIDPETLKPPYERARLELNRLRDRGWLKDGRVKAYYSELSDILRRYLDRQFSMDTLELTTFEILHEAGKKRFEGEVIAGIRKILEESDLVKFAKRVPPGSLAPELERVLERVLDVTRPVRSEAAEASGRQKKKPKK